MGGDPRWWLRRQIELELLDQEPEFRLRLSVTSEQQFAPIGGRQTNVNDLNGGELLESAAGGETWRQRMQSALQRDLQAVGQERNEDMSFEPACFLMEDWPYRQIALQVLERLFDGNELRVGTATTARDRSP